ncbi:hypothetical protein [Opitutus sp. ER46]|uniref:hypothetical protein n=1 Tax=Opitutus sp. ER46 TaxID=2161864 RepID=UPI0011B257BB|nr:hypothetical protein [Opitutus sp. ER46]
MPGPSAADVPSGWTPLPLEHLPAPTFWPAGLALAITFLFWGLISSWVILVIGLGLFAVSLGGWIKDIRHERKHHS